MSVFQKGTKVTICSDPEGKHPRRIGFVKQMGNGAWRLAKCSEWYNHDGRRVAVDSDRFAEYANTTHFARLYQEGDETAIVVEDARVKKYKDLVDGKKACEWRIRRERENVESNLRGAERAISYAREKVKEAERQLEWRKNALEQALAERAKVVGRNQEDTKAIAEHEGKLALIEVELAKFGVEW